MELLRTWPRPRSIVDAFRAYERKDSREGDVKQRREMNEAEGEAGRRSSREGRGGVCTHSSLASVISRRDIISPTPNRDTSDIWVILTFRPYMTQNVFDISYPLPVPASTLTIYLFLWPLFSCCRLMHRTMRPCVCLPQILPERSPFVLV